MRHDTTLAVFLFFLIVACNVFAQPQTVTTTATQTITGQKTFSGTDKLCLKDPSDTDKLCLNAPALGSATVSLTLPSSFGTGVVTWLQTPTGANLVSALSSGGGTTTFLRADGTFASVAGGSGIGDVVGPASAVNNGVALFDGTTGKLIKDGGALATVATSGSASDLGSGTLNAGRLPALTGDVTSSAGSAATTIANNAVTLGKMATVGTARFLGRATAGTGDVEALTGTQATALLNNMVGDSGSGGTRGLVPAPASGDAAAGKFLKADATWATVSASPGGSNTHVQFNNSGTFGGSANFTWDNSATKLKVLSATPSSSSPAYAGFSVLSNSSTAYTAMAVGRTATEGWFGVSGGTNDYLGGSAAGDIAILSKASQKLLFGTNDVGGASRMRIDSTGVGVGLNNGSSTTAVTPRTSLTVGQQTPITTFTGSSFGNMSILAGATSSNSWGTIDFTSSSDSGATAQARIGAKMTSSGTQLHFGVTHDYSGVTRIPLIIDHNADLTLSDITDIILGTSTGTKIGTATTQKLAFFNSTPIVQPGNTVSLETVLSNLGLRASGTSAPLAIAQLTIADASDIVLNTTTGTKIGTAASQKLALWNATPIVQPTTAVAAATFVANTSAIADDTATFDGYTIGQVVKALRNMGALQ